MVARAGAVDMRDTAEANEQESPAVKAAPWLPAVASCSSTGICSLSSWLMGRPR